MYKEHEAFTPPSSDAVLWRYMDFTKFVSLLEAQALFFARADKLKDDPFEGAFTTKNKQSHSISSADRMPENSMVQFINSIENLRGNSEEHLQGWRNVMKDIRRFMLINCWHESPHESAAMWRLYSRETDGIAIKTDFSSFKRSLKSSEDIYIGRVNYVDYERHFIPEDNFFYLYLHKRQDFNHEREVRAIATAFPQDVDGINPPPDTCDDGRYYEVDLFDLVKEVIVAPKADEWFLELIRSVAARYNLKAPVVKSRLADRPPWG